MLTKPHATGPEAQAPTNPSLTPRRVNKPSSTGAVAILDGAIFAFLCLFAILLPHSIKGAQHSWQLAFLLWLVKLFVDKSRPARQPLAAPLLAYIVFSAISTFLSPDPNLSWDRMKIACLLLVGIVVAQNVHRLSQVRTLLFLLILSGLAAAAFTGWQYTYGVGVRVAYVRGTSPLYRAHVYQDDIIQRINGVAVHTPEQLQRLVEQSPPGTLLQIDLVRGYPFHKWRTYIVREQMIESGLGTPELPLTRGHPLKAQGAMGHYVNFAEMLMQIACITWAMLLSTDARKRGVQVLLAVSFVALTAALFLTEVRAALGGLALGGFVALLMIAGKRSRLWATAALAVLLVAAVLWIHHTRGAIGMGQHDPGASFRTMMWEDGLRLIAQHPLFGVGMETIRNHWMEWHIRAFSYFHDESHFHNDMIQIAVERGLLAWAAWVWFVVAYVILLFRLIWRARERSRFATGAAAGLLGSFVAYQTTALVHYDLGIEPVAMILFFYFGLAIALDRIVPPQQFEVRDFVEPRDPAAMDVP